MNRWPPLLYVTLLLHSVFGNLPAPVNVSVDSHNFHHVLRWEPGPGTPPGTSYEIYNRVNRKKEFVNSTKTTSLELLLNNIYDECHLTVRAFYNQTLSSQESRSYAFTPYAGTKIGPAKLSLAGCGNCIQINISLPKPDNRSGVEDLQKLYDPVFIVLWRKKNVVAGAKSITTQSKNYTLNNLERGEEYCVRVETSIRVNTNTVPSAWECSFTSSVKPGRDSAVLGAVAILLIVVMCLLMTSVFCLYYAGFLCKLQATLPRVLRTVLSRGYNMTPEKTIPDPISISIETVKQRVHSNPTASHPATWDTNLEEENEDEEEEEGINVYMDRNAELSSGENSCASTNVPGSCNAATLGKFGNLTESLSALLEASPAEFGVGVVQGELDLDEANAKEATVSFMPEEGQTRVQEQMTGELEDNEMKKEEEACDSSENVNLFSVTLAALDVGEEVERNARDSLTLSDSDPLLDPVSKLNLNNTDCQMTESNNQISVALMQPTHEDLTETGYKGRHAHTQEQEDEEEEEEEEESSGYMAHT